MPLPVDETLQKAKLTVSKVLANAEEGFDQS